MMAGFRDWMENRADVASLFSGIGTLEAGMGARSVYASEIDGKTMDHFNMVHGTRHRAKDSTKADPKKIADSGASLFHASPVCKNFSCAKTWRGADDADRSSAESIVKVIRRARPPSVSVENVPEYANTALFSKIASALDEVGYKWDLNIVNSADYGGFQNRRRMILRAVLNGSLPPLPTKREPGDWFEAIKDLLPTAEPSELGREEGRRIGEMIRKGILNPRLPIISMGGSAFKGYWSAANSGGPAPTLKATRKEVPRIIMPDKRVLRVTPRMMARISSLPDSMPVPENYSMAKQYIGNGIDGTISRLFIAPLARRGHLGLN